MNFILFVSVSVFVFSYKTSSVSGAANDAFYTAGVVEFRPTITGGNSTDILDNNMYSYLAILESKEASDTDIIVFPEGTLNNQYNPTYVPSEKDKIIPCLTEPNNLYADFFMLLSYAARRLAKYVVVNLTEKENCSTNAEDPRPCANNNLNIYNTNVVFDREGRVISRYRKVHVYVEDKNTTYKPEFAVFDTDFGVRFGHFICFDMLFYTPAQELVDRFGITDFIFTSWFYSELPFLTAVQLQYGWAWGNNVNLLAAGASYPELGMTGSGIFSGEFGDLVSVMASESGVRKLYKARVPKKGSKFTPQNIAQRDINNQVPPTGRLKLLKDKQIENYNSNLVNILDSETYSKIDLCHDDLCCLFEINANIVNTSQDVSFRYRVGVFNGRRTYEKEEWSDIKVCALYACANENPASCSEALTTENVLFKSIYIKAYFPIANKMLIMPTLLDDQLYPLRQNAILWSKKQLNNQLEVDLKLTKEQNSIMTFGIYGQYYEKSAVGTTGHSTTANTRPVHCIITLIILTVIAKFLN